MKQNIWDDNVYGVYEVIKVKNDNKNEFFNFVCFLLYFRDFPSHYDV